jgi:hypothetical protein
VFGPTYWLPAAVVIAVLLAAHRFLRNDGKKNEGSF